MKKIILNEPIVEGVELGLEHATSEANTFHGRLTPEEAEYIRVTSSAISAGKEIAGIEKKADFIGQLALTNPVAALTLLGGEKEARQTMGNVATDQLMDMISAQQKGA